MASLVGGLVYGVAKALRLHAVTVLDCSGQVCALVGNLLHTAFRVEMNTACSQPRDRRRRCWAASISSHGMLQSLRCWLWRSVRVLALLRCNPSVSPKFRQILKLLFHSHQAGDPTNTLDRSIDFVVNQQNLHVVASAGNGDAVCACSRFSVRCAGFG